MILKRLNLMHLLPAEKDALQLDYKPPDKKINNSNLVSQLVNNIPTQHLNETTSSKMNQSVANNSVLYVSPAEKSVLCGEEKKFNKKRKIDTSALLELDSNTQHESNAKKFKNVLPNRSILNTQQIASQTQKQADAAQLNFDEEDLELDL